MKRKMACRFLTSVIRNSGKRHAPTRRINALSRLGVAALWLSLASIAPGLDLSLSPTNIQWNTQTWVNVEVTGVTAAADVFLGIYVDVDKDGNIGGDDYLVRGYDLSDGETNSLGSLVIPDDDDATVNGSIQTRVSFHGDEANHAIGSYVWQAIDKTNSTTATAAFEITQPTTPTWITGTIADAVTSNGVPGAWVVMDYGMSEDFQQLVAVTEGDGTFLIYLPEDAPGPDPNYVFGIKPGYLMSDPAFHPFSGALASGETTLPGPLYITPQGASGTVTVTGHVYDDQTNAVAGAWVEVENDGFAVSLSDSNGYFALPAPSNHETEVYCSAVGTGLMSYESGDEPVVFTANTNIEFYLPRADALARARVYDEDTNEGVEGVLVWFESDDYSGEGYSLNDGTYEVPLRGGSTYWAEAEGEDLWGQGYGSATEYQDVAISVGEVFTNAPFAVQKGFVVSGHVYDADTNGLSGGYVAIIEQSTGDWLGDSDVRDDGGFVVIGAPGTYELRAMDFDGYAQQSYPDPVVVTSNAITNLEFYLAAAGQISGHVYEEDGGAPIGGLHLYAVDYATGDWMAGVNTGPDGSYRLELPSGDYKVGTCADCSGHSYIDEWYNDKLDRNEAERVTVTAPDNTSGIDFHMARGGTISGHVYEQDGVTPIADLHVYAEDYDSGQWLGGGNTDSEGKYELMLPDGTYRVAACPSCSDQAYVSEWYDETEDFDDAIPVLVTAPGETTNINFTLDLAATISGTVLGEGVPLENAEIRILQPETNEWGDLQLQDIEWGETQGDGSYSVAVAPGSNYVVYAEGIGYLLGQYYDGVTDPDQAQGVTATLAAPATNINFDLPLGAGTIEGRMYEDDGVTLLTDGRLGFEDENDQWFNADVEDDGTYEIALPPGSYTVEARADGWLDQYYQGYYSYQWEEAQAVTVIALQTVSNINFTMEQPSVVEGTVLGDGSPIEGAEVEVQWVDPDTEWWSWVGNATTDSNGFYSAEAAPGSNFLVRVRPGSAGVYAGEYWSNAVSQSEATLIEVAATSTVSGIDFDLSQGMRIEGRVFDEFGTPLAEVWVDCSTRDTNGWWQWVADGNTDESGNYSLVVPAGEECYPHVGHQQHLDWWYLGMFYSNHWDRLGDGDPVSTNAGSTVSDVDFHLVPGYRVQGHVFSSDGSTPIPGAWVDIEYSGHTWSNSEGTDDGSGWYEFIVPSNEVVHLSGHANFYQSEYYDSTYVLAEAQPVQLAPKTAITIDFALYGDIEDTDEDGLLDYEEDTRPDGLYNPGEDQCSWTNADTDADGLTDFEEVMVTETGVADPDDYLRCVDVATVGDEVHISWSSEPDVNYTIQRTDNLLAPSSWSNVLSNITGTGGDMSRAASAGADKYYYRVVVEWGIPGP